MKASEKEIRKHLSAKAASVKIETVHETGSTNNDMKKRAREGEEEISVLIAEYQSAGKGRLGRSFFSPESTGIYMSILVRPAYTAEECTLLTTMTASSAAKAIEKVTGKKAELKWVNDIFLDGKKVGGILTEVSLAENRKNFEWAVVGIGVNLEKPKNDFPEELSSIASSVLDETSSETKNRLIAEIINNFAENYSELTKRKYLEDYRSRLFFLGEEITVIEGDKNYKATAIDIDSMCHLKIRFPDGKEKLLFSGEISIRI